MIEPFLWQAVVEEPCFVHHPEIHIGSAPVGPPEAEQQKGNRQPGDDPGEGPGPIVDEDQVFELACGHSGVSHAGEEARTLRGAQPTNGPPRGDNDYETDPPEAGRGGLLLDRERNPCAQSWRCGPGPRTPRPFRSGRRPVSCSWVGLARIATLDLLL